MSKENVILVPKGATVVVVPEPEQIFNYLEQSSSWETIKRESHREFVAKRKDDYGQEISITEIGKSRFYAITATIELIAAVEEKSIIDLVEEIKKF